MPTQNQPISKASLYGMLGGPAMLTAIPFLFLASYWVGGEMAMLATSVVLPLAIVLAKMISPRSSLLTAEKDPLTGLVMRDGLIAWMDGVLSNRGKSENQAAVLTLAIDDLDELEDRFGRSMRNTVLRDATERLQRHLRDSDILARLSPGFAVGLSRVRPPETENLLQMARRLQSLFDEPFSDGSTRTYCSLSIGVAAESHVKGGGGSNLVAGAQRACELAVISGQGSVRVYNDGLSSRRAHDRDTAQELSHALETGEIFAWFQPQLETRTGTVTGFEALARWEHPERGLVSPNSFLPDIEKAGLSQRLAEVILKQSLTALNAWDAAGFNVPNVSVNFSSEELRNPRLPDYVRWELDRHSLAPERLVVEVLESVVAESSEDVISRTLTSLSKIGCHIDLDDFGTGYTSFINIRRFTVSRIKLDRCLVSHIDTDEEQARMVAALLAFSDKLGIDALAEGVETQEEVDKLVSLGCEEMQGYVAAKPMALGETLLWLEGLPVTGAAFATPKMAASS